MRNNQSFDKFQTAQRKRTVTNIAADMQSIVFAASEPIRPGESVKAQIRRAWEALGRPPYWRVRAAWYREAGCWSGEAVRDFEARDHKRRLKEKAAQQHASHAAVALLALRDRYHAASDQDFHREQLVALDAALAAMGVDVGAVDRSKPEAG
jgi:hypothetical protein